jgi:hypothetical protein
MGGSDRAVVQRLSAILEGQWVLTRECGPNID